MLSFRGSLIGRVRGPTTLSTYVVSARLSWYGVLAFEVHTMHPWHTTPDRSVLSSVLRRDQLP